MCRSQEQLWLFSRMLCDCFFMLFILWPHCSCPNGLVTSNTAPDHPHATEEAVYPGLFWVFVLFCLTAAAQMLLKPQIPPLPTHTQLYPALLWQKYIGRDHGSSIKPITIMFANVNISEGKFKDYRIPLKLRFDPNDGSRRSWKSRDGSFDRIFK